MVTIQPVLWTRKNQQGLYPVKIRITKNRKSKYVSTGYAIKQSDWNPNKKIVRTSEHLHKVMNAKIKSMIDQIGSADIELNRTEEIVQAADIKAEVTKDKSRSFLKFANGHLEVLSQSENYRTFKRLRSVVRKLESYMGRKDLGFHELTVNFLKNYQLHLTKLGNKPTTVAADLGKIRTILRQGIREGHLAYEKDPFLQYHIAKPKVNKPKLTIDEIKRFKAVTVPPNSWQEKARDIFMFSFYTGGVRVGDLLMLRWKNILENRLRYTMGKTNKQKSILLLPAALEILEKYRSPDSEVDDFIFPALNNAVDYSNPTYLATQIEAKTTLINKNLKLVGKSAEIDTPISSHLARHSMADYLRQKGESIYNISKVLGHSKISVTEAYLKSLDEGAMDDAMGVLGEI